MKLLEPVDPNERFRQRRRQSRRRRSLRRVLLLAVVALAAAASALGMTFLNGWGEKTATTPSSASSPSESSQSAPSAPQPAALPDEIRGVHVTAALASLDGKLDEYLALADQGLTALQLDIKDENGEVGFTRQAPDRKSVV